MILDLQSQREAQEIHAKHLTQKPVPLGPNRLKKGRMLRLRNALISLGESKRGYGSLHGVEHPQNP